MFRIYIFTPAIVLNERKSMRLHFTAVLGLALISSPWAGTYRFDGKDLRDASGGPVASISGNDIHDRYGSTVGTISGSSIRDRYGSTIASFSGNNVRDEKAGRSLGSLSDVKRDIEGSGGISMVAMWVLFVHPPSGGGSSSSSSASPSNRPSNPSAEYRFDGKSLQTRSGSYVASLDGSYIRDRSGGTLGSISGQYILNASGSTVGSYGSGYVRDGSGSTIGSTRDMLRSIDGDDNVNTAAMWVLAVKGLGKARQNSSTSASAPQTVPEKAGGKRKASSGSPAVQSGAEAQNEPQTQEISGAQENAVPEDEPGQPTEEAAQPAEPAQKNTVKNAPQKKRGKWERALDKAADILLDQ
jgi:hypothetical protein